MNRERYNEILSKLLELNETVETTTLLEELRNGFNEPGTVDTSKELEDANNRYKELEQLYISTFKSNLQNTTVKETPKSTPEINSTPDIKVATFDDIFKEN